VEDGFEWVSAPWGLRLAARSFSHVAHGWTTRQLRLRGTPDEERMGWAAVAEAADTAADHLVRLRQVHGAAVHVAGSVDEDRTSAPEADIAMSASADLVLTVQIADCAPILLTDAAGRVAAAAHAGWRGVEANVAGVTVGAMSSRWELPAESLRAAVGPCIGPCCYEVGTELLESFRARGWREADCERWFQRRDGRLFLDLWQACTDQLARAGLPQSQISLSRLCTACHTDWLCSYRREGAGAGRLAGFIRARPTPLSPS
jgi:hypothetical protein